MSPGEVEVGAEGGEASGKDGVAFEAFGFVKFTGIDVGFAGVASGVDEEGGAALGEGGAGEGGIAKDGTGNGCVGDGAGLEEAAEGLPDVSGGSGDGDHGRRGRVGGGGGKTKSDLWGVRGNVTIGLLRGGREFANR